MDAFFLSEGGVVNLYRIYPYPRKIGILLQYGLLGSRIG